MSREAYHPPTLIPQPNQSGGVPSATTAANPAFDTAKPVQYLCGDCNAKVLLRRGEAVRCKECGHRVLYKERTNRMVQFEAR